METAAAIPKSAPWDACGEAPPPDFDPMVCLNAMQSCRPLSIRGKRRVERFPEENATLAFDADLTPYKGMGTRERLLRRIIARLYRDGVMNHSANVVEAGMFIGDNAVPFASLLSSLHTAGAPMGTVFALDPMERNCQTTRRLARWNGISNICMLRSAVGDKPSTAMIKQRTGPRVPIKQVSLDSLDLPNVGFIHLDVEGFEDRAIRGASRLIESNHPFIVTERHTGDKFDDGLLLTRGYRVAEIPEVCGPNLSCRNRLWIPSGKWAESMRLIRAELKRPLVPEHSPELAEV